MKFTELQSQTEALHRQSTTINTAGRVGMVVLKHS
jgi:hypothetical protein